ncbi:MAG: TlpA family protein disulfide reductase [Gemmatimonadetes bacterium]|nr:TlpA family protein disulfide reductase [Gemmatimonadota bacterium]MXY82369.1 TlpA family protein disulfide reductase [Gemmatimonadota bacterium]MYB68278.1 TlpA family protein disulfide reductase [Gemmatimonadota bacterium]
MGDQKSWKVAGLVSVVLLIALIFKEKSGEPTGIVWSEGDAKRSDYLSEGTDAPDFELPSVQGGHVRLGRFKGQRVGLAFVTPTCPYCDDLERYLVEFDLPEGRQLLLVSQGTKDQVQQIVKNHDLTIPVLVDSAGAVSQAYRIGGVPQFYVVSEEGTIASFARGMPSVWEAVQKL